MAGRVWMADLDRRSAPAPTCAAPQLVHPRFLLDRHRCWRAMMWPPAALGQPRQRCPFRALAARQAVAPRRSTSGPSPKADCLGEHLALCRTAHDMLDGAALRSPRDRVSYTHTSLLSKRARHNSRPLTRGVKSTTIFRCLGRMLHAQDSMMGLTKGGKPHIKGITALDGSESRPRSGQYTN